MKTFLTCLGLLLFSPYNLAEQQQVTLELPTMNCAMCPLTVKKALGRVKGVISADVQLDTKHATVKYEDTQTNTDALITATTNACYPSKLLNNSEND